MDTVAENTLLESLRLIVGEAHLLDRKQANERASHFWDSRALEARALVRPADTQQTAAVLAACHAAGQVVVTHGGVTGLVDGNRSTEHDIVVSLERQTRIESIDPVGRTLTVQAGALLQQVQAEAAAANLQLGLDLGSRGSCTIGGNISTNAGGLSVLRYGMAREQVLGLEAVLADGTVVSSMNHMMKNNTGYDLKQLFIGSEGTLGIVTRVVLRLRPATPHVNTALLAFHRFDDVTATLRQLDSDFNGTLNAFEIMWQAFYQLNTDPARDDTVNAPLPSNYPLYAIVERRCASASDSDDVFVSALARLMDAEHIADAVIAKSDQETATIWRIREHVDIALEPEPVFVYDISLPVADMQRYVDTLTQQLETLWPAMRLHVYGHLADGNLHVLVAPFANDNNTHNRPGDAASTVAQQGKIRSASPASATDSMHEHCNQLVYGPLQALGGSISAEHGIGLYKKAYLHLSRNTSEIAMMKALKLHLDPRNILNRGKIFDV